MALSKAEGWTSNWTTCAAEVSRGNVDLCLSTFWDTAQRRQKPDVAYAGPYKSEELDLHVLYATSTSQTGSDETELSFMTFFENLLPWEGQAFQVISPLLVGGVLLVLMISVCGFWCLGMKTSANCALSDFRKTAKEVVCGAFDVMPVVDNKLPGLELTWSGKLIVLSLAFVLPFIWAQYIAAITSQLVSDTLFKPKFHAGFDNIQTFANKGGAICALGGIKVIRPFIRLLWILLLILS